MKGENKKLDIDLEFLQKEDSKNIVAKQIDGSKTTPVVEQNPIVATTTPRPWIRYWARYLDIVVFSLVFGIFLTIFIPSVLELSNIFLTMFILFVWIFVESILLTYWGTTPGKWLLRINLLGSNGKPKFSNALNRSFEVWIKGLGLGIPFITLFTLISSYDNLKKQGVTPWDRDEHFTVTYGKIGIIRGIIAVVLSILFFSLIYQW